MQHPIRTESCPPAAALRVRVAAGLALAAVLGAGCGQKGPLFLPPPAASQASPPAATADEAARSKGGAGAAAAPAR
jgi:predicted small lipoprotein YifL